MKSYDIRLVQEADSEDILRIYEPYISETVITFEFDVPTVEEFRKRIQGIAEFYPYIVCMDGDKVIGYAYAHRHKERAAYQWNVELSVYIDKPYQRCGIGKELYGALIDILKLQNIQNVYAGVTYPNESSEKLHEYFGFYKLGVYHNTGYKFDAWHDVMLFEKKIGNYELDPKPILSIDQVDKKLIDEILNKYQINIK